MNDVCYTAACGGTITERWYGDTQDLSCEYGYGMQCPDGDAYAEELCKGCPQRYHSMENEF